MGKKRPTPEQIVTLLRQIEVATSQGKSIAVACREAEISDQSHARRAVERRDLLQPQVSIGADRAMAPTPQHNPPALRARL